jgi:hypothetical protein
MKIIPITKIDVINTIKSLKTIILSGYDGISNNKIIKPFTFTSTPH